MFKWIKKLLEPPEDMGWRKVKVFTSPYKTHNGINGIMTLAFGWQDKNGNRKLEETNDGELFGVSQQALDWQNGAQDGL